MTNERYEICKACEHFTKFKTCTQCGCFMPAKTLIPWENCPIGKWKSTTSYDTHMEQIEAIEYTTREEDGKTYVTYGNGQEISFDTLPEESMKQIIIQFAPK